jgi:hypothetical protein
MIPTSFNDLDMACQWVARHGNKISYAMAKQYFPAGLDENKYRR